MVDLNIIIDYIRQLKSIHKQHLYNSPVLATSIIKIFDDSTIRLIYDLLLTAPSIKSLQKNEEIKNSLKTLLKISLIYKKGTNIFIDNIFRNAFLTGIELNNLNEYYEILEPIKCTVSKNTKFEEILKFLVTKNNVNHAPGVVNVLKFSNLIDNNYDITNKGFEFLLKPRYDQYWFLIIAALKFYCVDEILQISNFMSIMELSNMLPIYKYKLKKDVNKKFYDFLSYLGLIKLENDILTIYHNLFVKSDTKKLRFILLETNFKLYAYTSSVYEMSIIQLFSNIYLKMPNLIKASITEDSLSNAFSKGVTSQQIINFLKSYSLFEDIPVAIISQIIIWETKRKRIKIFPGYLYSNFLNLIDYQKVVKFCLSNDCIIEKDDEKRMIVIKPDYNEVVKKFVKQQINK